MSSEPFATVVQYPDPPPRVQNWERFWMDIGERLASGAIFCLVGAIAAIIASRGAFGDVARASASSRVYGVLLAATVVLSDLSLIAGFVAWWRGRYWHHIAPHAKGLMCVSLFLAAVAVTLFALAKLERLNPCVDQLLHWVGAR